MVDGVAMCDAKFFFKVQKSHFFQEKIFEKKNIYIMTIFGTILFEKNNNRGY